MFAKQNLNFVKKNFVGDNKKKICSFVYNHKECKIDIFIKNNSVNIIPNGKNKEECKSLIDFILSKGFNANVKANQTNFNCNQQLLDELLFFINDNFVNEIKIEKRDNYIKLIGYNQDCIHLHFYPTKNKVMMQGKPFFVFNIVTTFLSEHASLTLENIIEINNDITGSNAIANLIKDEIKMILKYSYSFFDEALVKSISGSYSQFKSTIPSEDYTGCLTGVFRALEGYLTKLFTTKYPNHKIEKMHKFSMFHKSNSTKSSAVDRDNTMQTNEKIELNNLYKLYANKRNVYLHTDINTATTSIITNKQDAQNIRDEILNAIEESYKVINNI